MGSSLADFIERHADAILAKAIDFAKSMDVAASLDGDAFRDHLAEISQAFVTDLRTT